jgi:hypothetical protein
MKHEELQILVSAYHDGELNPEERVLVEAHLVECAECAEALRAYQRMGRTVSALPRGAPSRQLWLRVQESLPTRKRRSLWWRLLPVASTLTLLLVGLTVTLLLDPMDWRNGGTFQRLAQSDEALGVTLEDGADQSAEERKVVPPGEPPVGYGEDDWQEGDHALATPAAAPSPPPPDADQPTIEGIAAVPPAAAASCFAPSLSVLSLERAKSLDVRLASPQIRGFLYDADDNPFVSATVVVSGTDGWLGTATTDADGAFLLSLPAEGPYRILAWAPEDAQTLGFYYRADTYAENEQKEILECLTLLYRDLLPIVLAPHDLITLTLRLR